MSNRLPHVYFVGPIVLEYTVAFIGKKIDLIWTLAQLSNERKKASMGGRGRS